MMSNRRRSFIAYGSIGFANPDAGHMRFVHLGLLTWWRDDSNASDMAEAELFSEQIQAPAHQRYDGGRIVQRQFVGRSIGIAVAFGICLQDVLVQTADWETPFLPTAHELDH